MKGRVIIIAGASDGIGFAATTRDFTLMRSRRAGRTKAPPGNG